MKAIGLEKMLVGLGVFNERFTRRRGRRRGVKTAIVVLAAAALFGTVVQARSHELSFPKDYRSWAHSKSMVIPDKSSPLYGFHHVYVNEKALKAYKAGKGAYPEGSALTADFFEVKDEKGTIEQGKRIMVAVMKKDREAKETGGWFYGAFGPDGKAMEIDVKKQCYECHTSAKDKDYVFSAYAE